MTRGRGDSNAGEQALVERLFVCLAVTSVLVCLFALATRTLTSLDLGYHLAYGEHALITGQLVDHNAYLYTLPPLDLPASARPSSSKSSMRSWK